ncbi:hypothetical protein JHK85_003282 [Glycine max]|nr:hypothetical protein JHK85_003282 [Glycine max]
MPRSRRSNPRLAERVFSATKTGRLDYLVNLYMHSLRYELVEECVDDYDAKPGICEYELVEECVDDYDAKPGICELRKAVLEELGICELRKAVLEELKMHNWLVQDFNYEVFQGKNVICHDFQLVKEIISQALYAIRKSTLLAAILREPHQIQPQLGSTAVFIAGTPDIAPITSTGDFYREFMVESKKLGYLAGPAIFSFVSKYSLGAFTQIFAGHVGTIDLAAVSVENSLIAGFSYGIMLGMGSALETLCGQAVGAGKLDMLGVYMQRSWVLLLSMAFVLWPMYIFAGQVLKFIGQDTQISEAAGTFAIWMIPQLFAYALNFPVAKFLQAQVLSWLLMVKLELGLVGAAVVLNGSWWWLSWFMCLVGGVGLRGTASRGKRFGISVDSFASLLLLLLCFAWKHVLYGSDFVCWIPQECTSLCRRLLYLLLNIG